MNGIYIPGLNMPNSCVECLINYYFCHMDYKYFLAHQELYDQRSPNCPLVPVPPHGRLIDADELTALVYANIALFRKQYQNDLESAYIVNPVAHALYEVWKIADSKPAVKRKEE